MRLPPEDSSNSSPVWGAPGRGEEGLVAGDAGGPVERQHTGDGPLAVGCGEAGRGDEGGALSKQKSTCK